MALSSMPMFCGKSSFMETHLEITPQALTNIGTEVEDTHAEAKELREEIHEVKCKL